MKTIIPLIILTVLTTLACNGISTAPDATPPAEGSESPAQAQELRGDETTAQLQRANATAAPEPTPEPSNICHRFPALQKDILDTLDLGQCTLATYPELFRIERLSFEANPTATRLRAGDFAGLVNLTELGIQFYDSCGQWDDLAFTDALVAELPSLASFGLTLYRKELDRSDSSAEEIANVVFLAIHNGREIQPNRRDSETNEESMRARIDGPSGSVRVEIYQDEDLPPCRRGTSGNRQESLS